MANGKGILVNEFLNTCISKFLCVRSIIDKSTATTKKGKTYGPVMGQLSIRDRPRRGVTITSDASRKAPRGCVGLGVLVRDENGMPISCQLSWNFQRGTVVSMEMLGIRNGLLIAYFKQYEDVLVQTDCGDANDLLTANHTYLSKKTTNDTEALKMPEVVMSKYLLTHGNWRGNWRSAFIFRHMNMPADFLARYARCLKEHGWYEETEEIYINKSGLQVVKKISSDSIYFENCIPSQLREVLEYEAGIHYYTTMSDGLKSIIEVEVVRTLRDTSILYWTYVLTRCIDMGVLKCFFIELRRDDVLVEQLEVRVRYNDHLDQLSDFKFNRLLYNLEVLGQLPDTPDKVIATLLMRFYKMSAQKELEIKDIKEGLVWVPKDEIELPAVYLDLGRYKVGKAELYVGIRTNLAQGYIYPSYREGKKKYLEYKEALKKVDDMDLGKFFEVEDGAYLVKGNVVHQEVE